MGVLSTEVAPQQVLLIEQEIKALLEKVAIEYVPHSNRETGFYSQYFIVPKKDGGMRPILDLRVLNEASPHDEDHAVMPSCLGKWPWNMYLTPTGKPDFTANIS